MKITEIKTKIYNASVYSNWIFVFIETDIGLTGLGEATLDGFEENVVNTIRDIKALLIGEDIIENYSPPFIDRSNIINAAVFSGIDMAIWDLKGKYYNKPISLMLNDLAREQLEVYATFNRALKSREIEDYEKIAFEIVSKGYKGIKCAPFDGVSPGEIKENEKFISRGLERIKHIRAVIGDSVKLKVDCHWRFDYFGVQNLLTKLEPFNLYWLEAPISENNPHHMKLLRSKMNMLLAGGEMQTLKNEYSMLLQGDALDVYMPDIKFIGGISGFWDVGRFIEQFNCFISPHNMSGPVASAASIQLASALESFLVLEMHIRESEWSEYVSNFNCKLIEGKIQVSKKPGLGIELDMKEIEQHPYKKAEFLRNNMLGVK